MSTKIEWTGETWNPVVGCSIESPGCTNCYAMRMAARLELMSAVQFPHYAGLTKPSKAGAVWTGKVAQAPDGILLKPLTWRKPRTIFVCSMADLFHDDVPDAWIDRVFAVMALCPQHTFQVLTKRSRRMREYLSRITKAIVDDKVLIEVATELALSWAHPQCKRVWPLPNVWLGVSAERQQEADARIPDLLATPAAVRFVSAEPLLGPIDFRHFRYDNGATPQHHDALTGFSTETPWAYVAGSGRVRDPFSRGKLDWIIVGGESGPGARPMHPDWAKDIVRQCKAAGVPVFVKQIGANATNREGEPHPAKNRKGGDPTEWPDEIRVREMPDAR